MPSLQQFIDQVLDVAASINPDVLQDAEGVTESLLSIVWQDLAEKWAGDEERRQILKQSLTITTVDGTATLSPNVLTSTLNDSLLYDPANPTDLYSFVPNFSSLFGQDVSLLGQYAIEFGAQIRVVQPDVLFDPASGPSQDFMLNVTVIPSIPATATDPIIAPGEWISDAVDMCAQKLQAITPQGVAAQ